MLALPPQPLAPQLVAVAAALQLVVHVLQPLCPCAMQLHSKFSLQPHEHCPGTRKCCCASFSWHSPQFLFVWRSKTQASAFYLQRLLNASELSPRCHPGCLLARRCSCGSSRPSSPSHTIRAETLVFGACHVARTTRQRLQFAQQWPQFHQQFNSSTLLLVLAAPVPIWSQDPYRPAIVANIPPRFCSRGQFF